MAEYPDPPEFERIEENRGIPIPIGGAAAWIEGNPERVASAVYCYFYPHPDQEKIFQGQHFEWFIGRSDPSRFTTDDLAAIGALAVSVPAQTGRHLVEDLDGTFQDLLARCHAEITECDLAAPELNLATCPDEWIESNDSPFALLYNEVRALPGVGYVTCSKLLATKFPALIPIRDGRVERLLELEKDNHWWKPMRQLLQTRGVLEVLQGITLPSGSATPTTLRRLDVALWMEARSRGIGDRKTTR